MKRMIMTIIGLLLGGLVSAATLTVPGQYASIGAAIGAAKDGDEIVVSPGTYGGFIVDKRLTIRSTYDGSDWSIVENTIIRTNENLGNIIEIVDINRVDGSVLRGFTLTRNPITVLPNTNVSAPGIASGGVDATIDSCIIENCVAVNTQGTNAGAAIGGIEGTIQNCIIRNNRADAGVIAGCRGIFRNNLMHNNVGGSVANFIGDVINNTVYEDQDSFDSGVGALSGLVANNIFWKSSGNLAYGGPVPRNSIISGYTGPGVSISTADPKFVNPAAGDFRLKSDSPAIDAGLTTGTVSKADIKGVQRGLQGVQQLRGDGSAIDIGAFEFIPEPVGVWLPGGGPDLIQSGDNLKVAWKLTPPAGTAVLLRLMAQGVPVFDYGAFFNASGQDVESLLLPASLPTHDSYWIQARSSFNPSLIATTPFFRIQNPQNFIHPGIWTLYE